MTGTTHITEAHRRAFSAPTSGRHDHFALLSCYIDGAPGAAIVTVEECAPAGEGGPPGYAIRPLFVSVTPAMTLTDHDGREA